MLHIFSPSKVNLFLQVIKKRSDGYHELASLFQAISLGDRLQFELNDQDVLTCSDLSLPVDQRNLVLKAAHLFRHKTGINVGLKVHLTKHIPSQAGLGGGSGNAASTLWAFNQLMGSIASEEELCAWSSEIGSDIPFFFSHGTAYCTGRGENVQSLDCLPTTSCWIVKPLVSLSTPEVFKNVRLDHLNSYAEDDGYLQHFLTGQSVYFNDLEKPAFELKPELKELKLELQSCGFDTVLMTGSGSAFFCLGAGQPPIRPDLFVHQAHFLNRSTNRWYEHS